MLDRECPVCDYLPNDNDLCPLCIGVGAVSVYQEIDALLPQHAKTHTFADRDAVLVSIFKRSDTGLKRSFKEIAFQIVSVDNNNQSGLVAVKGLEGEILPWVTLPTRIFQDKMLQVAVGYIFFAYVGMKKEQHMQADVDLPLKGIRAFRADMKVAHLSRAPSKEFSADKRVLSFKLELMGTLVKETQAPIKSYNRCDSSAPPFSWLDARVINRLGFSANGAFYCYVFKVDYEGPDTYDLFGEDYFGMPNPMADIVKLTSKHIFELSAQQVIAPTLKGTPAVRSKEAGGTYYDTDAYFKRSDNARVNLTDNNYNQHWRRNNQSSHHHHTKQNYANTTYTWNGKAHLKSSTEEFKPGTLMDKEKIFDWEE